MKINSKFDNLEISFDGVLSIFNNGTSSLEINGEYKEDNTSLIEKSIYCPYEKKIITLLNVQYKYKSRNRSTLTPSVIFISDKKYPNSLENIYLKELVFSLDNCNNFYGNEHDLNLKSIELQYESFCIKISFAWCFKIGERTNKI